MEADLVTDAFRLVIGARSPPLSAEPLDDLRPHALDCLMLLDRLRNAAKVTELLTELHHINSPGENSVSRQFTWCLTIRMLS